MLRPLSFTCVESHLELSRAGQTPISGGKQQRAQMSLEKVLSREFFANRESSTAKLGFDANQPRSKCLLDVARYHEYLYGETKHFFSSVLQS